MCASVTVCKDCRCLDRQQSTRNGGEDVEREDPAIAVGRSGSGQPWHVTRKFKGFVSCAGVIDLQFLTDRTPECIHGIHSHQRWSQVLHHTSSSSEGSMASIVSMGLSGLKPTEIRCFKIDAEAEHRETDMDHVVRGLAKLAVRSQSLLGSEAGEKA